MRPFKNIMVYAFDEPFTMWTNELEELMKQHPLRDCGQDELEVYGWLPAFTQSENYVEATNNCFFIRLGMEIKKLPKKAIITETEKRARDNNIDITNRLRFKEIQEIITNEFIPKTPAEQSSINAYIDLDKNWLVIDAASEKKASLVTAVLRKTLGSLPIVTHAPQVEMPIMMTDWVRSNSLGDKFGLLDEIEMKELSKEDGGTARYKGIPLDSKEIEANLNDGWSATRIGMTYEDILSFSIGVDFIIKRVKYLDQFQERLETSDDQNAIAQSNAYLLADTVRNLVPDLFIECTGGNAK